MDSVHDFSKGIAEWVPTHHLHRGYHLLWYRRGVFAGEDSAIGRLCAGCSSLPLRPAQAVPPVHVTYSVTFASPPVYSEAWSRFPYSVRLGDQALRRASVPSETDPSYVDWFRVSSHPYLLPGEGPIVGFGPADSIVEYVSFFNLFLLLCICII